MAIESSVAGTASRAKHRSRSGAMGWTIPTFGIYHLIWWSNVNREARDLGHADGLSAVGDNYGDALRS